MRDPRLDALGDELSRLIGGNADWLTGADWAEVTQRVGVAYFAELAWPDAAMRRFLYAIHLEAQQSALPKGDV